MRPYRAVALAAAVAAAVLSAGSAAASPAEDGSRIVAPARPGDPPATDRDHDRLADDLAARLGRATGSDRVDVIVRGVGVGGARAAVGSFAVRRLLPLVDGFSARVTAGQARALTRVPGVVRVDAVRTVRVTDTATDRDFGAALARQTFSTTGAGVGVCVVDTGVDPAHEQIAPRTVVFRDLIGTGTQPYDDHGHGTHVASIAAGDGDSATGTTSATAAAHIGVAPGASLYAAKVLDAGGSGPNDVVLSGIQWCAAQPGVDVVSMSLGDSVPSDGSDPISVAVDQATADGTAVVVAAGNAGDAPSTIPSPGAARTAITVEPSATGRPRPAPTTATPVSRWHRSPRAVRCWLPAARTPSRTCRRRGSRSRPLTRAPEPATSRSPGRRWPRRTSPVSSHWGCRRPLRRVRLRSPQPWRAPPSTAAWPARTRSGVGPGRRQALQRLTGAANQAATTFPTFSRTTGSVPTGGSTTSRCRSRTAASRSP